MKTNTTTIKAIGLICFGFFLVTVMAMLSKLLTGIHHPIEIAFYRNLVGVIAMAIFIITHKRYDILRTKRPWALTLRGLIGALGLIACLSAVQNLPMATSTTLFFAATLMVPIFATIFLKEKVGLHRWSAVFIGMAGVIIVAQPSADVTMFGIILGLTGAFFIACAHIVLRWLKDENSLTVTASYFIFALIIPAFFMPFIGKIPTLESAFILLGIGITGGVFQYILTIALKMAPASVINPFNYTGLLWSIVFDIVIWNALPGANVWAGASLIISANLYIIYREYKNTKALL